MHVPHHHTVQSTQADFVWLLRRIHSLLPPAQRPVDETALGRQEDWEEPRGRAAAARVAIPDFAA